MKVVSEKSYRRELIWDALALLVLTGFLMWFYRQFGVWYVQLIMIVLALGSLVVSLANIWSVCHRKIFRRRWIARNDERYRFFKLQAGHTTYVSNLLFAIGVLGFSLGYNGKGGNFLQVDLLLATLVLILLNVLTYQVTLLVLQWRG